MKKLLGLAAILLALLGCGAIEDGTVTAKDFSPAHDEEVLKFMQVGDITIPYWETVHHPDAWSVTFRKYNEKSRDWDYRAMEVTKETYDAYAEGDYIDFRPKR